MKRVLLVAYEGRVKGESEPFEVVKEERPLAVVLGAGDLLPGIEEALEEMREGEEREVELPPERAFGERRPDLIVIIPEREFRRRGIRPYPGLPIEADGRRGRVLAVSSGRVQVDFNHPMAGKTVVYRIKVLKELSEPEEAVVHLFRRFFGFEPEEVELEDGKLRVSYIFSPNGDAVERAFVAYVMEHLGLKEVRMEKIYRLKEKSDESSGQ